MGIAEDLEKKGYDVMYFVRGSGETIKLINEFGLKHSVYLKPGTSKYHRIIDMPFALLKVIYQQFKFKPDLILGFGLYSAISSFILRKSSIVFTDSEPRMSSSLSLQFKLFIPFVDAVITPTSFLEDLGPKQVRINSYKELSYLHPNYFRPNDDILELLKLKRNEDFVLIRFCDFNAVHDFGKSGFGLNDKILLINKLSEYAKVFVSFEGEVPKEIEKYKLKVPKRRIHDVLYYAKLFVCDTGTMATESAILGTPVIRSTSLVGIKDAGNFIELEHNYGLIYNIQDPKIAINKAEELIQNPLLKYEWLDKKEKMLKDKCDIRKFIIQFIDNYCA